MPEIQMSEPFVGQITLFPYSFPPKNWADCQGQLIPIQQNTALFSLLGTYYGGDGRTNFGLPNLQGAVPVGAGQLTDGTDYINGSTAGAANVTIDTGSMPVHNHTLNATTATGATNAPRDQVLASVFQGDFQSQTQGNVYNPAVVDTALTPNTLLPTGGGTAHNNLQPYLALRYCIALVGIFPARP